MLSAAEEGQLDSGPLSWMGDLAMVLGLTFVVLLAALMLAATYFFIKRGRSQS